jgi:hypothetical protein
VCAESRGRHAWVEEVPERNYSSTVKAVSVTAVLRGNLVWRRGGRRWDSVPVVRGCHIAGWRIGVGSVPMFEVRV